MDSLLLFIFSHESCIFTQIAQNPSSGLPSCSSAWACLCHLQIQPALQSPARLSHIIIERLFVKAEIHPKLNNVAFVDVSSGRKFLTRSTMRSGKTEKIDGIDHHLIICDITSDSHPAYTGEKRFVDTAGRVEKFNSKFRRRR
jgi:large subunit ribosomal protein L31